MRYGELTGERHRFVTGPRLSPDGTRAAWIGWDHPRMPWDGTELIVADVAADGTLTGARTVVSGPEESVPQADWTHDNRLLYASDRTGWWNLYRDGEPVCPRPEEFAGPLWKLGQRWFAPLDGGLIAVLHGKGAQRLGVLDPETCELVDAAGPWSEFGPTLAALGERVVAVGAGPRTSYEVVELDTRTGRARVIGAAHRDAVDPAYYPEPEARTFPGPDGREIHAQVYPPRNPDRTGPDGELPVRDLGARRPHRPLPVGPRPGDRLLHLARHRRRRGRLRRLHRIRPRLPQPAARPVGRGRRGGLRRRRAGPRRGGHRRPRPARRPRRQRRRLDHRRLPHHHRRLRLRHDHLPGARPHRLGHRETHDFESQYLETLIGPRAEVPERYEERSPVTHADRLRAPFLLLQGMDDVICPPVQCERFLDRLVGRGVPHAYLTFEGEGHGFRRAETMVRALEAELSLYAQVFGLKTPGIPALELTP